MQEEDIVWSGEMNRREEDYFQGVILASDIVNVLIEPLKRDRVSGKSLARKAKAYVNEPTPVQVCLKRGLTAADLAWDYHDRSKFISIVDADGAEIRDLASRRSVPAYYSSKHP